jgi:hypothetical protein
MTRRTVLGFALVGLTILGGGITPRALAAPAAAVPVTTSAVSYHLAAQLLSGANAGSTLAGQVNGTLDSTGILTATLTLTSVSGLTAAVSGTIGASAKLTVKGKAGNLTLSGKDLNASAGVWGGSVGSNAGSWLLTAEPQSVTLSVGGTSGMGSAEKLALAGQLTLQLTPQGWGEGTFAFLNTNTVLQAEGRVVNGNLTATIFWSKQDTLMLVAAGKQAVGITKWSGTFVGPAAKDYGTFLGEG